MVIEDYEKVYQLWMSCTGMGLNNLDDSQEGIEKFLKRNPDTCFVAEDHEIIGVILAGMMAGEDISIIRQYTRIIENRGLQQIW